MEIKKRKKTARKRCSRSCNCIMSNICIIALPLQYHALIASRAVCKLTVPLTALISLRTVEISDGVIIVCSSVSIDSLDDR